MWLFFEFFSWVVLIWLKKTPTKTKFTLHFTFTLFNLLLTPQLKYSNQTTPEAPFDNKMKNDRKNSRFICEVGKWVEGGCEMFSYIFSFSVKKILWGGGKNFFFHKNKEGWSSSTHKNEHEMKNISPFHLIYFPTPHTIFLSFSILLSNGA